MSEDHPDSKVMSDSNTFAITDDDECVLEDDDACEIDEDECLMQDTTVTDASDGGVAGIMTMSNTAIVYKDGDDDDDEEQHVIHDQLPSVEEIKSSPAYFSTANILTRNKRKKQLYNAAGVGIIATVLIIIITAIVASSVNHRTNNDDDAAATTTTAFVNTDANLVGGDPGSPVEHGNLVFNNRVDKVNDYLWKNHISDLPSLITVGTPEHYASVFMAVADNYHSQMLPENQQHFIERYILALVYYGMNGNEWTNSYDFLHAKDHCLWTGYSTTPAGSFIKGVECDAEGYVIGLDLSNNNLISRNIPKELHRLLHLEKLHLQHNELGGNIPDLSMIFQMKSIGLMDTGITGSIPDWIGAKWSKSLTTLGLSKNVNMQSTIPKSFRNLMHMEVLALDGINLKGSMGPIKGLTSLLGLYLEDNMLTGTLEGNQWSQIVELDVSGNVLTGSIPSLLLQRSQLQILDLNRNLFTGDIPQDIMINDAIQYISMHVNALRGQLSDRIGYLTNLKHLDVGGNLLTGTIPDTIKQLTNLVTFSTAGNNFTSSLLNDYFSDMTQLEDLSLKANNFMGRLPQFLGELTSLVLLDLDANDFSGTIPTDFGSLTNLHALMLNRNELTGTIPSALTNLSRLKVLLLDSNNLKGKTTEICKSPLGMQLQHFIADCYPGKGGMDISPPEIECRCCSLCCNDDDLTCNNKNWMVEKNYNALYGSMEDAYYLFGVEEAPEGWAQKAITEARETAVPAATATATATASTSTSTVVP